MANKLFNAELYDVSDIYSRENEWMRYEHIYIAAESLEKATKIANDKSKENQIVVSIREIIDQEFYE